MLAGLATLALGLGLFCGHATAGELKVLTTGAFKPVVTEVAKRFSEATGTQVSVDNDTAARSPAAWRVGKPSTCSFWTPAALGALRRAGGLDRARRYRSPRSASVSR